ncbi:MAG: histidinol dehydrogenase [Rubricoccaceae bacterium]|nr:histidinol dehydrogenase [Rubricoccaceae bacterium]
MILTAYRYADLSEREVERLCARPAGLDGAVLAAVEAIEREVRADGDDALHALNARYDTPVDALRVPAGRLGEAWTAADPSFRDAVETAGANLRAFHAPQRPVAYRVEPMPGVRLWRETRPVERAGLYVPGGTAPLVSTLLMTAIPAQIAGCPRIVVCTPPPAAEGVLAVAGFLGLDEVYQVGGAQAVFALAYGTETVPRVDLIAGPGNAYVAAAKWRASRVCAVDLVAGPSEVLIIADEAADPDWIAADLLAQAEHGADSQVVLLTTDAAMVERVQNALSEQLADLPRRETAKRALARSFAVVTDTLEDAVAFSDRYAPEHLILNVTDWAPLAASVSNAGSVFCGALTPESVGDYASGTNHTLPTAGFARSTSGLTVERFLRTVTFQALDEDGLGALAPAVTTLARAEGLEAHARAVTLRQETLSSRAKRSDLVGTDGMASPPSRGPLRSSQ